MATSASASTKWPASLLIDVAGPSLTAEASGGLLALLAGVFPGSGSAWLGPSQKGDLPKFRRAASFVGSRSPTRADLLRQFRSLSVGLRRVLAFVAIGLGFLFLRKGVVFRCAGPRRHVFRRAAQPCRRVVSNHAPGHIGA